MNTPSSSSLFYRLLFVFVVFVVLCPCDARRPRAFIHIGPHKTGSTTIQTTLSTLYDQLPPGIKTLEDKPKLLRWFARAVMFNADLTPHSAFLEEINKKDKDIIFSAEGLDMPKNIRSTNRLADIFKDYDVTIIAFLREPLAHLISYWSQLVCARKEKAPLPQYLTTKLAELEVISSFPPPSEIPPPEREEIVIDEKYQQALVHVPFKMSFEEEEDETKMLLGGGNGWELFRTLDLYRHSFNVPTKKEKKKKKKKKGEEGEGENKIVLIDFDGVLASGKTLAEVLLNEVVGLEDIDIPDLHAKDQSLFLTALNIWQFYTKDRAESIGCRNVINLTMEVRERLEAKGGLKACTKMSDFYKIKRELDDYFGKKLEESGFEVLYGGKRREWTGFKDCYVVDKEIGKTLNLIKESPTQQRRKEKKARPFRREKAGEIEKPLREKKRTVEERVEKKREFNEKRESWRN